jgi:predicted DCC family thiol-disulfide oxidoreductase YuxK
MNATPFPHDSLFDPRAVCPGYTGGQYSMVRAFMALLLALHLLRFASSPGIMLLYSTGDAPALLWFVPNVFGLLATTPQAVVMLLAASVGLCILLAVGWLDRVAAALLWYVLASMFVYEPIGWLKGMPFIGWTLLAHVLIGGSPYGSWKARGQTDPRGGWAMPRVVCGACWFMLALGYMLQSLMLATSRPWLSGTVLHGMFPDIPSAALATFACTVTAVGLLFPVIAPVRRARPWLWAWTLIVHQALLLSTAFHATNLGMILLHLLCFDPSWIAPRKAVGRDTVFFDSHCGLCHHIVRFALSEDLAGNLCFAPLHGETFERALNEDQRHNLPDSVVVYTAEGRLLTRSAAVIRVMQRLGGLWVILADVLGLIPKLVRDPM